MRFARYLSSKQTHPSLTKATGTGVGVPLITRYAAPRVSCRRPAQILGSGFSLGLTSVPTLCKGILLHGLNRTNPAMLQPPNESHCLEARTRSLTPGDPPGYRLSPCAVLECVLRAPSDGFQDASRVNSRVTNPVSRLSRPPARFSYPGPATTKKEALMLTPATLIPF